MAKKKKYNVPSIIDSLLSDEVHSNEALSIITNIEESDESSPIDDLPREMPVLPLRNMVLYPATVLPI
jgi:hypothetical protein